MSRPGVPWPAGVGAVLVLELETVLLCSGEQAQETRDQWLGPVVQMEVRTPVTGFPL